MIVPFAAVLIAALLALSLSSVWGVKLNQYALQTDKLPDSEVLIYKEKIVKEAADSFCRENFETCKTEAAASGGQLVLTMSDLTGYMPGLSSLAIGTSLFLEIMVDTTSKQIVLTHTMDAIEDREAYSKNYLNTDSYCGDGGALPCSTAYIGVKKAYSEELQILFIDDQITELEAKLSEDETYPGEHADIQAEIDDLNTQKDALNAAISSRKVASL